ncbi:MAG: hypothetical protein ABW252_26225 [Polyangiales bacterium]
MQIDGARALVLRLIVGEVLARRGEGPLARRPVPRRAPARQVGDAPTSAHDAPSKEGEGRP